MNASNLVFEKASNDLVIEVINIDYPVFVDGSKPSVAIKGWYIGSLYHHVYVETKDSSVWHNRAACRYGLLKSSTFRCSLNTLCIVCT